MHWRSFDVRVAGGAVAVGSTPASVLRNAALACGSGLWCLVWRAGVVSAASGRSWLGPAVSLGGEHLT